VWFNVCRFLVICNQAITAQGYCKSSEKLAESEEALLEHRTDGTDAFDTLYIGCEKFPFQQSVSIYTGGVL
jgi:hypothetical protein